MKREILFRGYSEALNKWVEGDLVQFRGGSIAIRMAYDSRSASGYQIIPVHPDSVGQFTGFEDSSENLIYFGHEVIVCVFFVSPENPDNDIHFKGNIIHHNGNTCIEIFEFMTSNLLWKKLSETTSGFPFDTDYIEENGTTIIPLFDLCAMSGNLGEYLSDNVQITGNTFKPN
jgi:hypothetical protein